MGSGSSAQAASRALPAGLQRQDNPRASRASLEARPLGQRKPTRGEKRSGGRGARPRSRGPAPEPVHRGRGRPGVGAPWTRPERGRRRLLGAPGESARGRGLAVVGVSGGGFSGAGPGLGSGCALGSRVRGRAWDLGLGRGLGCPDPRRGLQAGDARLGPRGQARKLGSPVSAPSLAFRLGVSPQGPGSWRRLLPASGRRGLASACAAGSSRNL